MWSRDAESARSERQTIIIIIIIIIIITCSLLKLLISIYMSIIH